MTKKKSNLPRLYLITDRKQCHNLIETVEKALIAGVRMVQLREKDLDSKSLYDIALQLRTLTKKYKSLFIVNDRIDIALASQADGIQIGEKSLPITELSKLIRNSHCTKFFIGYSAHSFAEAKALEELGVNWVTMSPVFESKSKKGYGPAIDLAELKNITSQLKIPVYALGGIDSSNVSDVMAVDVHGVALISDIMASDKPEEACRLILSKL